MKGKLEDIDVGELALERGFEHDAPNILFRVVSRRGMLRGKGKKYRHTNWFVNLKAAQDHARWVNDGRGEVLRVSKYILDPNGSWIDPERADGRDEHA